MRASVLGVGVFWLGGSLCLAQAGFELASVKVSELGRMGGEGSRKGNLSSEPGSLIIRNLTLKACVSWAYHVRDYQVTGPGWIENERYDIMAKSGDPVKEDGLRKMLQTLLAERFKLAVHRETRELPVYVLTVDRGGSRMKPSEGAGESSFQPVKSMGKLVMTISHTTVGQFADVLGSGLLQLPVLDQTGLAGAYDFTIDISRYIDPTLGPGAGVTSPIDRSMAENAITMALREQLGLRLESKKSPLDIVVVDRAERVPTEN